MTATIAPLHFVMTHRFSQQTYVMITCDTVPVIICEHLTEIALWEKKKRKKTTEAYTLELNLDYLYHVNNFILS